MRRWVSKADRWLTIAIVVFAAWLALGGVLDIARREWRNAAIYLAQAAFLGGAAYLSERSHRSRAQNQVDGSGA